MDILFLIALGFALSKAVDYARKGAAESRSARLKDISKKHPNISKTRRSAMLRRHDAGYWAGELVKGFPEARHGFMSGWHAHRTAVDEARLARDKARADHEENRASIREQAAVHRRRMQVALEEQQRAAEGEREAAERRQEAKGKGATVTPLPVRPLKPVPDLPADPEPAPEPLPAGDGWPTGIPHRRKPEGTQDGPEADSPVPPAGDAHRPASGSPAQPATEGAPVATTTESTYTEDLAEANAIRDEAEQHLADLKRRRWMDRVEALASAGLDRDTLSHAADMNDSINDQIKAAEKTLENATAFRDGLKSKHEAGHEYHSGTDGGGMEKSYLADR